MRVKKAEQVKATDKTRLTLSPRLFLWEKRYYPPKVIKGF